MYMAGKSHQVLSALEAASSLEAILNRVSQQNQRVIVTANQSDAQCVMISKAELDGLEQALEILSGVRDVAAMRAEVLRIATAVSSMSHVAMHTLS
jgi:PHD/YefM family antitoxin component YafN of YafNO toxin-antitoxin module